MEWVRIPAPIENDADRRALAAILTNAGLAVRIEKVRTGTSRSAPWKRFVEYSEK